MQRVEYLQATRTYPGATAPAVSHLDLVVDAREFLVMVGPSGSGKSTALRMLAGLERVDEGQITIGDTDVTALTPKQRDIAMVFQNYALYPNMSVADNMGFALKLQRVPRSERDRRVAQVARLLDIDELLGRKPAQLSGGQRQRVAMGRAIVRKPKAFLMDEPLSNLDAKLRVQTRAELASLQRRIGTTTLYVTHDQVEAMTLGDRVAVLRDGRLQQVDAPRALYERPANAFVAGFIGSPPMNLLTLPIGEDGAALGPIRLPVARTTREALAARGQRSATIGIRPESLRANGATGGLALVVDVVEELGADAYVYGVPAGAFDSPHRIVVRIDAKATPRRGSTIHVEVPADDLHTFDPETGVRL
jgi:multiple sugar transport system ATP-binding protein